MSQTDFATLDVNGVAIPDSKLAAAIAEFVRDTDAVAQQSRPAVRGG